MVLDTLRFVVGTDGRSTAIQMDIETWRKGVLTHVVKALEDAEDVNLAREALAELKAAGGDPDKAGWLRLSE